MLSIENHDIISFNFADKLSGFEFNWYLNVQLWP